MLTMVIVSVGTVGMLKLLAAGSMANAASTDTMIGLTLANNVREMLQTSAKFSFADPTNPSHWGMETGETASTANDLDDFDGYTFTTPVDGRRQTITYLPNWTQTIKVESVDPNNVKLVVPHGTQTPDQRPMSRVTVTVNHNSAFVCQVSWLVCYAP
jgi:Tfp pilus assembly protein PilV